MIYLAKLSQTHCCVTDALISKDYLLPKKCHQKQIPTRSPKALTGTITSSTWSQGYGNN